MADSQTLLLASKGPTTVPDWFFNEDGLCGLTKAGFIWWSNVLCCCFHTVLAIVSIAAASVGGNGLATPLLTVYLTNLTWVPNATNSLVPINEPVNGVSLAWLTLIFFMLSALAHGIIVAGNWRQGLFGLDPEMRKVTRFSGWYFVWIHQCRQPLRYAQQKELEHKPCTKQDDCLEDAQHHQRLVIHPPCCRSGGSSTPSRPAS